MITLLVNPTAGRATELRAALENVPGLELRDVSPENLSSEIQLAIRSGASRIAVAGGDGTVASAAAAVTGRPIELAVIPAGTLDHFAKDLGIPTDVRAAAEIASAGATARAVDVGRINGRLMLNTSSVGAYTTFVRARDRFERTMGYRLASILAAVRTLARLRSMRVELEVEGRALEYRTPLVFVGVGEREVRIPMLGARVRNGRRGLHVFVVKKGSTWGFLTAAAMGALRGARELSRSDHVDAYLVDRIRIHLRRPTIVAVDGELLALPSPLEYRLDRDALRVVVPPDAR